MVYSMSCFIMCYIVRHVSCAMIYMYVCMYICMYVCMSLCVCFRSEEKSVGCMIDCLELFDPEIVQVSSEEQLSLIYGKESAPAHTYLQTLVTERLSWSRLRSCINQLLSSASNCQQ